METNIDVQGTWSRMVSHWQPAVLVTAGLAGGLTLTTMVIGSSLDVVVQASETAIEAAPVDTPAPKANGTGVFEEGRCGRPVRRGHDPVGLLKHGHDRCVPGRARRPSNLVAANGADQGRKRSADLTWTDTSTNETGFTIERATNAAFTTGLKSTTVTAGSVSASLAGLSRTRHPKRAVPHAGWYFLEGESQSVTEL